MDNWNQCLCKAVRIISPDILKAKSLTRVAKARMSFLEKSENQDDLNFIFEGYYSCLLELLHAQLLKSGYKVENHICIGFYIRDVLNDESLYRSFDDFRYKRNSLVYYGKEMNIDVAKETVTKIKKVIADLQ